MGKNTERRLVAIERGFLMSDRSDPIDDGFGRQVRVEHVVERATGGPGQSVRYSVKASGVYVTGGHRISKTWDLVLPTRPAPWAKEELRHACKSIPGSIWSLLKIVPQAIRREVEYGDEFADPEPSVFGRSFGKVVCPDCGLKMGKHEVGRKRSGELFPLCPIEAVLVPDF